MVKNTPREPDMTPPNPGNARHRTDYNGGDDGRCDQSEKGIEGNEASTPKVK